MVRSLAAVASLLAFAPSGPAQAGWEYTKWKMTPEQVREASSDNLSEPNDYDRRVKTQGNLVPLLTGEHRSGSYNYMVDFLFDEDQRLQRVVLNLENDERCAMLISSLKSRYGQTSIDRSEGSASSLEWQDVNHENVISLWSVPGLHTCTLTYSYTLTAHAK